METIDRVMEACRCPLALNRRQFIAGCAACAAGVGRMAALSAAPAAAGAPAKPKVRLVFTYIPSNRPIWPNIGYDFGRRKKELVENLTRACPGIEFLPATVHNRNQARKLLQEDKQVDGYLVYMLGLFTGAPQVIGASGRPTLFVDDLYGGSGEFLVAFAEARRRGWKVAGVSSSRFDDVAAAARCFDILKKPNGSVDAFLAACKEARLKRTKPVGDLTCAEDRVQTVSVDDCMKKLRSSTILTVGGGWGMPGSGRAIEKVFGTKVVRIEFKELHEAYMKADRAEALKWADRWSAGAEKIIEPKRVDIENSGAMYLAMRAVMQRRNAQGITINCLGGFYGGHIKAYPCLGFTQLNDDGLVGACEADIISTITMLAFSSLTGRPGFISDPVIDTSKNQIIYAHCVAPTKVFGPKGTSNPYHIRNHSEDRKGAALRSLLPLGYMTTTLEIHCGRRELIWHQGKSVANIEEDKACRTKLAVEVKGDMDKLFAEWDVWRWHRVTFYGDLSGHIKDIAKAANLRLIEEA